MITFKCKMCGGDLSFEPGSSIAECPYCGTNQTLPKLDDDKRANLYDRANHFRRQNEYDKAMAIYEQVLEEDRTDAEAYWSLVLCRYGIEYVEDPTSHKRVPTVNRMQYASILADEDYKSALAHANEAQRSIYEAEANAIAEIQKGILDVSRQEKPFDIFICYKETDEKGRRTQDSALAQDIYFQLVNAGYRVFFSRITLEEKLGQQYEPYIFAALNSAKIMLIVGTKAEYYNAVWVKNEWSRFLTLAKRDKSRLIIPCYRDMDPYELPDELSIFQCQDMSKIGFIQDIVRGIKKVLPNGSSHTQNDTTAQADSKEKAVDSYAIELINKTMNEELQKCNSEMRIIEKQLSDLKSAFEQKSRRLQKKTRSEYNSLVEQYQRKLDVLKTRCESTKSRFILIRDNPDERNKWVNAFIKRENQYQEAQRLMQNREYQEAKDIYISLGGLYDSSAKAVECEKALIQDTYDKAVLHQKRKEWNDAYLTFMSLGDYRDSIKRASKCQRRLSFFDKVNNAYKTDSIKTVNTQSKAVKRKKRLPRKLRIVFLAVLALLVIAGVLLGLKTFRDTVQKTRNKAATLLNTGEYDRAISLYKSIGEKAGANYALGCKLENQGDFDGAIEAFEDAGTFDSASEELECIQAYKKAEYLLENGDRDGAIQAFAEAASCYDAVQRKGELCYIKAEELLKANDKKGAAFAYEQAIPYADANDRVKKLYNELGEAAFAIGDYEEAIYNFEKTENDDSIAKAKYEQSLRLLSEGDYGGAYRILVTQQDREEVRMLIANTPELSNLRKQEFLTVGNTVLMGNLEWIVINVDGKRSMLITKDTLRGVPFNTERSEVVWENATIRTWLNERFYNDAFSEDEKKAIIVTKVYNGSDQGYSKYVEAKGRTTKDKLFFLSYKEAWSYFFDDDSRKVSLSTWWLRSPGRYKNHAATVNSLGEVGSDYVDDTLNQIRPVMWVDTNKM